MRAIVQVAYGSTDVLELRDLECPVPDDDEVLVRVCGPAGAELVRSLGRPTRSTTRR